MGPAVKWIIGLILTASACFGQELVIERTTIVRVQGLTIEEAIRRLESLYGMQFAYSPDRLPLARTVDWRFQEQPTETDLINFWSRYGIRSQRIDNLFVMSADPDFVVEQSIPELSVNTTEAIYPVREAYQVSLLDQRKIPAYLPSVVPEVIHAPGSMKLPPLQPEKYQITFLPGISSGGVMPQLKAYHLSFNMLWGQTGLVEGVEVGGLINEVTWDMTGLQLAGFINQVGESMEGFQISGGVNVNHGRTWGAQFASLANITGSMEGLQIAGMFNVAHGDVVGVQCAGGANLAYGATNDFQFAGIFNKAKGSSRTQVSGLFNSAGNVKGWQLSALGNRADTVYGSQVGLVNIADSLTGASIGLLNFVKHGHNRISLAASAAFPVEITGSLGSRALHNLLNVGWQKTGDHPFWALGYGLGSYLALRDWGGINLEGLAQWIIAGNQLDRNGVLYSAKLDLEIAVTRKLAIFGGPSWQIFGHPDRDVLPDGSVEFRPWTGRTRELDHSNWRVYHWTGWSAGIRYGLK